MRLRYAMVVARTDLKCLFRSRYYWIPMTILSGLLFVVIPAMVLWMAARSTPSPVIQQISDTIQALPPQIQENILGDTPGGRAAYGLAVFLLAPIAIVVPMTVSSAVGANAIVGERERGTGEFLARRLVRRCAGRATVASLADQLGPEVSRCGPAHALAVLADERMPR